MGDKMTEVDLLYFDDNKDDKIAPVKNSKNVIEANNRVRREKKIESNHESLVKNVGLDPERHNVAIKGSGKTPKSVNDRDLIPYGSSKENRGRPKGAKTKSGGNKVRKGKRVKQPDGSFITIWDDEK